MTLPLRSSRPWTEMVIVLKRPTEGELKSLPRDKRYAILRSRSEKARQSLLTDLAKSGLKDEAELHTATAFDILVARGTERAFNKMRRNPWVEELRPVSSEIHLDLLGT